MERLLGRSPPLEKKKRYESDFLLTLQMTFCEMLMFEVYEVGSEVVKFQLLPLVYYETTGGMKLNTIFLWRQRDLWPE